MDTLFLSNENRQQGTFYWVNYNDKWVIARYDGYQDWRLSNDEASFHDVAFSYIDETPLKYTRDK